MAAVLRLSRRRVSPDPDPFGGSYPSPDPSLYNKHGSAARLEQGVGTFHSFQRTFHDKASDLNDLTPLEGVEGVECALAPITRQGRD